MAVWGFEDGVLYSPGLEQGLERTLAVETAWDVLSFHVPVYVHVYTHA